MSVNKTLYVFICGVCVFGMINCGKGKYADAKKVTVRYLEAMEKYAKAVEEANSPESLVKAVDRFADEMAALRPEMAAIEKKYPELADAATPPSEMEDLAQRMNTLSQRLVAAQTKLMKYATDPQVQRALQKLQEIR